MKILYCTNYMINSKIILNDFEHYYYNEFIGQIIDKNIIAISGTHGKTSTSSMLRHLLEGTLGCNYFIGAGDGYATKDNKYFVVESDEFNRHFTAYKPKYSIITNIEAEHMECYKDIDEIIKYIDKIKVNNILFIKGDSNAN